MNGSAFHFEQWRFRDRSPVSLPPVLLARAKEGWEHLEITGLDCAANVLYDTIFDQHFHLHLLNQVVAFVQVEEAV